MNIFDQFLSIFNHSPFWPHMTLCTRIDQGFYWNFCYWIHFWLLKFQLNWPNIDEIDRNAENWRTQIQFILSCFTRHICLQSVYINCFWASGYWLSYVYWNLISSLEFSIVWLILYNRNSKSNIRTQQKGARQRQIDIEKHIHSISTHSQNACV